MDIYLIKFVSWDATSNDGERTMLNSYDVVSFSHHGETKLEFQY
jgi:hypothetical protein